MLNRIVPRASFPYSFEYFKNYFSTYLSQHSCFFVLCTYLNSSNTLQTTQRLSHHALHRRESKMWRGASGGRNFRVKIQAHPLGDWDGFGAILGSFRLFSINFYAVKLVDFSSMRTRIIGVKASTLTT